MRRIGELLVAQGSVTEAAITRALHYQRMSGSGARLGTILLNWDLLAEDRLIEQLARLHRCEPVSWASLAAARPEVARLLTPAAAIRHGAVPYDTDRSGVRVAFLNPSDLRAVDEVGALLRRRVLAGVTSEVRLLQAHSKFYGRRLTQETRAIIHKVQRRQAASGASQRLRTPGEVIDFRQLDAAERPRPPLGPSATRSGAEEATNISIAAGGEDSPRPAPPEPSPTLDLHAPGRSEDLPRPDLAAREPTHHSSAELREWVGEALVAFQNGALRDSGGEPETEGSGASRDKAPERAPSDVTGGPLTPVSFEAIPVLPELEALAPVREQPPAEDGPAPADETGGDGEIGGGLWRPSRLDEGDDAAVSSMWTAPDAPGAPTPPEGHSREEVVRAVVETHVAGIPRTVVLGSDRNGTVAWYARGTGPGAGPELWIAPGERSIFAHVERTGAPHFGPLELELWPRSFADVLGAKPPECAVFPVRIRDAVAAFLYADRVGEPMIYEDFGVLTRAAALLGAALTRFLPDSNHSTSAH